MAMASSAINGSMSCNISFRQTQIPSPFKTKRTKQFFSGFPKSRPNRTVVRAERATWLPGLDPPPYLDGKSVLQTWPFKLSICQNWN